MAKRIAKAAPGGVPNSDLTIEFGATGLRQFSGYVRESFLRELTGWRGLRMYREMRDNDPIIGAMFFALEMLLRGLTFNIEPASPAPEDQEAAAFVESCISDMEQSWPELVSEILTFLQYGYSVFEIVYKFRSGESLDPTKNSRFNDGLMGWRKHAGRAQETLLHWNFDESGDAIEMVQLLPTGGSLLTVPLAKCLHFRTRLLKNNPEGVSILRNAYVPYYFKKRIQEIEAIGIERDLAGLPVAWVPPRLLATDANASDQAQLAAIKQMVRDTVRNEQEGFVLPLLYDKEHGHKLYDFTLLSTGGRRQFDTNQIVDRYDHRITATLLADFIMLGSSGSSGRGSYAQSKNKTDMFGIAITGFADLICAEFNRKAIPDLLDINGFKGRCMMRHGDVSEASVADFAQAVAQVTTAGAITPDPGSENAIRTKLGLPPQPGVTTDDMNQGGEADKDADTTGAVTDSDNPRDAQGQGRYGTAADATLNKRKVRKRRKARA